MRLSHETKFIILARPPEYDNNTLLGASLVAQMVKCLSAMWETWVRSLGWEDLLEKEMATCSNISCLRNPMDRRSLMGCSSWGGKRVGHDLVIKQQ